VPGWPGAAPAAPNTIVCGNDEDDAADEDEIEGFLRAAIIVCTCDAFTAFLATEAAISSNIFPTDLHYQE
jgi:hypothetical protein